MIKFKIKTPKNNIEILKSVSIDKYSIEKEPWVYILVMIVFLMFPIIPLELLNTEDIGNRSLILILTYLVEFLLIVSLSMKHFKTEKKELKNKFYKIFKIDKSDKKIIGFLEENIDFIENENLSNKELFKLVHNYKDYQKEISKIRSLSEKKNEYTIKNIEKENNRLVKIRINKIVSVL